MDWLHHLSDHPFLLIMLLVIGFVGLFVELFLMSYGILGLIGIFSFSLYFFGQFFAGAVSWEIPALFILGLLVLVLELILPSFGVLGGIGLAILIASIFLAAPSIGIAFLAVVSGLVVASIVIWILVRVFKFQFSWGKFVLQTTQLNEEGYNSQEDRTPLLGKMGYTLTPLKPSGFAQFDDRREDVVSEGPAILGGTRVQVIKVEGSRVVVRTVKDEQS